MTQHRGAGMARIHITIPDDVLRDAQAVKVNLSGASREGICARTYGRGVLVPIPWYESQLAATGSDGPGVDPPAVWPLDLSRTAQPVDQDHDELEQSVHELR